MSKKHLLINNRCFLYIGGTPMVKKTKLRFKKNQTKNRCQKKTPFLATTLRHLTSKFIRSRALDTVWPSETSVSGAFEFVLEATARFPFGRTRNHQPVGDRVTFPSPASHWTDHANSPHEPSFPPNFACPSLERDVKILDTSRLHPLHVAGVDIRHCFEKNKVKQNNPHMPNQRTHQI